MKQRFASRRFIVAGLLWGAIVAWTHHLARDPFNVRYYKQYVVARCTDVEHTRRADMPLSDKTRELAEAFKACEDVDVVVDGVWGGIYGKPSVRLKVTSKDGSRVEMKYYAVSINPVAGIASVSYDLDPSWYYLTL